MINRVASKLSFARRGLLATAALSTLAIPMSLGIVQASARQPQGQSAYTFVTIEVPGSSLTAATDIDAFGRVAGYYVDGSGVTHGYVLRGGALSTIDFPGAGWTAVYGINASGQIVGAYGPNDRDGRHGFLLSGGIFSSFEFPGSNDTVARGMNNRGQIVGDYLGQDALRHGFLLSGGNYNTIEVPQSGGGVASSITDSGQIAGLAGTGANVKGFVFTDGTYLPVQFPDSGYTEALGMNNLGDVVGLIDRSQAPSRGFRRNGSNFTIIELPDHPFSWDARGINDLGQIVGTFTSREGRTLGYRATPAALKPGPADTQEITRITIVAPWTNALPAANQIVPGLQGPPGPQGPQGPQGPPGPAAKRDAPSATEKLTRALVTLRNRVNSGSSAIQKTVAYRQGGEMGKALEKAVAQLTVVTEDVAGALAFVNGHPEVATTPARSIMEIEFDAPVPGGTAGPNVPPGVAIGLNNLKAGFDAFKGSAGGDLGDFRDKIDKDLAKAVELVFTAVKANVVQEQRGRRGGR